MASTTELTFTAAGPAFRLREQPAPFLARDVVSLSVTEGTDGLRSLTMTLNGGSPDPARPQDPSRHLDRGDLDFGAELQVYLGPDENQHLVFDGTVSAIAVRHELRHPPVVTVCAEDALMRLRMTRRMATYTNVDDAQLAREIADKHGLDVEATAEGPRYDVVQQWNQSDLAFLRERARLIQAELWCTGRTLHFATRDQRQPGELSLVRDGHLRHIEIAADLAHQRSTVTLTGYDASKQEVIDEEAGADVVTDEVPGGTTGPRLVADALGASATFRVRESVLTSGEARAYARAEMLRRGRRLVTAAGTAVGAPTMTVGSRLTLVDVGPIFDGGDYYVTQVHHAFDLEQGYLTHFEAERGYINEVH